MSLHSERILAAMTPDMKNIEDRIVRSLPTLASNQKKVANFFLEHLDLVACFPSASRPQNRGQRGHRRPLVAPRLPRLQELKGTTLQQPQGSAFPGALSPGRGGEGQSPDVLKLASQNVISIFMGHPLDRHQVFPLRSRTSSPPSASTASVWNSPTSRS